MPVIAAPVIECPPDGADAEASVEVVKDEVDVEAPVGMTKADWLMHKMRHIPRNPQCKACVMGKTFAKPSRASENSSLSAATTEAESLCMSQRAAHPRVGIVPAPRHIDV